MESASPSSKQASKSCLIEKEPTLSPPARESTCDIVQSSETRLGLLTFDSTGRIPTRSYHVGLFSLLSESFAASSLTIRKLKIGIVTSSQD